MLNENVNMGHYSLHLIAKKPLIFPIDNSFVL